MKHASANRKVRSYKRKSVQNSSNDVHPNVVDYGINILDDQLAEIIFKFIPMCQWSSSLEYVSKKFRRCVLLAFRRIKFINLKKLFSLKQNKSTSDSQLLSTRGKPIFLNIVLMKLLSVCPNVTGIAVDYFGFRLCPQSTWNILKKFQNLQSFSWESEIEIKYKHFADFVAVSKSLTNLTISCRNYKGDDGILDIGSLSSVYKKCMHHVRLENLSEKLTSLTLDSFCLSFMNTYEAEQAMKICINLESLSVGICNMEDYKILFNVLPNLCKLSNLCVSRRGYLGNNVFDKNFCAQLDLIKNQLLIVEIDAKLSNEMQHFLFTKCSNLQRLKLAHFQALSAEALKNVPNFPCNLKELHYEDDRGQILRLILPNLVQLSNFTDLTVCGNNKNPLTLTKEWENICCLVGLQHLRAYNSYDCSWFLSCDPRHSDPCQLGFINDSLLEKWDKKNDKMFENLVTLEIPFSCGISDAGACLLAKKAKNLQILDLCGSQITEKTISIVAEVAKKLTTANFAYCDPSLDENVFLRFIKKAACLKKLEISETLVKKLVCHDDFAPFVEQVVINAVYSPFVAPY